MARKRIADMLSYKFSMDLSGDNKIAMDNMTEKFGMKYGPFLNFLIKKLCRMPDSMKQAFIAFCLQKCSEINDRLANAEGFEKKDLEEEKNSYLEMARIFNGGTPVEFSEEDPTMKKYMMEDGVLIVPKDWIILNPELEGKCRYAGVVECRNHLKYDIPHFVFFTDIQYACDYDKHYTENIYELCTEKWSRFKEIRDKEVKLIPDPEKPGRYINEEEHLASPVIGLFHILRNDDEHYDDDPPYGAVIVNTEVSDSRPKK